MELGITRFIPARHYTNASRTRKDIRLIVIHDMEAPEHHTTAEGVARYFAAGSVVASAHVNHDTNSSVRSVRDEDIAYAAPGANHDGLHHELAGYARQTTKQWLDESSRAVMNRAAYRVAKECKKYGIPIRHLSNEELRAGRRGLVGHRQVSEVYDLSTHTDPGPNFPWGHFLDRVRYWYDRRFALPPKADIPNKPTLRVGDHGRAVSEAQRNLNYWISRNAFWGIDVVKLDGTFNPAMKNKVIVFQRKKKLAQDGVIGPATWRELLKR